MAAKRSGGRVPVQGELEMALGADPVVADEPAGDPAPPEPTTDAGEPAAAAGTTPDGPDDPAALPAAPEPAAGAGDDDRLRDALEGLDRRVTLLIERYRELGLRHAEAVEDGQRSAAALARLTERGGDPAALDARIRRLEAENERLARHAGFLEERIRNLLSRVRYVIES